MFVSGSEPFITIVSQTQLMVLARPPDCSDEQQNMVASWCRMNWQTLTCLSNSHIHEEDKLLNKKETDVFTLNPTPISPHTRVNLNNFLIITHVMIVILNCFCGTWHRRTTISPFWLFLSLLLLDFHLAFCPFSLNEPFVPGGIREGKIICRSKTVSPTMERVHGQPATVTDIAEPPRWRDHTRPIIFFFFFFKSSKPRSTLLNVFEASGLAESLLWPLSLLLFILLFVDVVILTAVAAEVDEIIKSSSVS